MPDELPPAASGADPPPAPPPDRLTKLNTLVTVLAGICTLIIGAWVKLNEAQFQKFDAETKMHLGKIEEATRRIETREKVEEASYKFAQQFLTQIKDSFKDNARGTQMAVAALNIIAQASAGGDGTSSAAARGELPLHMALLLGDAGSIVTLDPQQEHREEWCEFAAVDSDDRTRLTAILALCALSRQSVRKGNLDQVDRCTLRIEQLHALLAESDTPSAAEQRTLALAAEGKLAAFLTLNAKGLKAARLAESDVRNPEAVMAEILQRLEPAVSTLQERAVKLRAEINDEPAGRRTPEPVAAPGEAAPNSQTRQLQVLASVNDALQAMAFARTSSAPAADSPRPGPPQQQQQQQQQTAPGQESADASDDPKAPEIKKLIEQLTSADTPTRRKARSDLALFRQAAVKPMLGRLREPFSTENAAYNTRLGVATALSRMVQPITLDLEQATQVAAFLGAPDADSRVAAADFLMNLENSATIQNAYDAISVLLKNRKGRQESGNLVKNAAGVLGTWTRVLSEDNGSPASGISMKEYARRTVEQLKVELEKEDSTGWSQTIAVIKEHLQRGPAQAQSSR